jgi:hypothetical protein
VERATECEFYVDPMTMNSCSSTLGDVVGNGQSCALKRIAQIACRIFARVVLHEWPVRVRMDTADETVDTPRS